MDINNQVNIIAQLIKHLPNTHPRDPVLKTCAINNTFFQLIQNKNLILAVPRKINFSDILLRPSGTSSYSSEISEAFVTV